jgi:type II secretory pathway pseudopilin PulG
MDSLRASQRSSQDDSGFSLPELLVYMLLLVIVLSIVGGILATTQRVEGRVRASTQASTSAQLAVNSVESGIRNSRAFSVVNIGDNQLLIARTIDGGQPVTWSCTTWYFDKAAGTLRYTVSDPVTPSSLSAPTATQLKTWTLLTDGIRPTGTTKPFTVVGTDQLDIEFEAVVAGRASTVISSSADSRAAKWESAPCF